MFNILTCFLKTRSVSLGPCLTSLVSQMHCKITHNFLNMQVFKSFKQRYATLHNVIQCYTKLFAFFFGVFEIFLYLCRALE